MLDQRIEIAIRVQEQMTAIDAERADDHVDGRARRDLAVDANLRSMQTCRPHASPDRGARIVRRKAVSHIAPMNRQTRPPSAFSKVSVKSQTVIPREVRVRLKLQPGDTLRYRLTAAGVLLDKAPAAEADDPFAAFSEWSSEADEEAYGEL